VINPLRFSTASNSTVCVLDASLRPGEPQQLDFLLQPSLYIAAQDIEGEPVLLGLLEAGLDRRKDAYEGLAGDLQLLTGREPIEDPRRLSDPSRKRGH
jgi:hypothetical protein